jgi:hypothetical protein
MALPIPYNLLPSAAHVWLRIAASMPEVEAERSRHLWKYSHPAFSFALPAL